MKFIDFLTRAKQDKFWVSSKTYCFYDEKYPILFFHLLFEFLKKNKTINEIKRLNFDSKNKSIFYSTLKQSFLGQINFYWLGNLESRFKSKGKSFTEVFNFIADYKGPHTVILFSSSKNILKKSKNIEFIQMPQINKFVLKKIIDFFELKISASKINFLNKAFETYFEFDLESVCMLLKYLELINSKYLDKFYKYWILMMGNQGSLASLTDNFFAGRPKKFFRIWLQIKDDYPDVFWVIFWSEHIWRAIQVVYFLNRKNFSSAKKISFRLPYNFIRFYYKNYNLKDLYNLYQFLYDIDYKIKTGSNFAALDLFYCNHFNL